jgi:hypothetical protein
MTENSHRADFNAPNQMWDHRPTRMQVGRHPREETVSMDRWESGFKASRRFVLCALLLALLPAALAHGQTQPPMPEATAATAASGDAHGDEIAGRTGKSAGPGQPGRGSGCTRYVGPAAE